MFSNTDFTHSPADVLRWLMIALNLGSDPALKLAWPIHVGKEPDLPDNAMTIYDTEGYDDGREMVTGQLMYHYGVQIRIRASDEQPNGHAQCSSVRRTLAEGVSRATVNVPAGAGGPGSTVPAATYQVDAITHIGPTLHLGWEAPNSKRTAFTLNAAISLRQVA